MAGSGVKSVSPVTELPDPGPAALQPQPGGAQVAHGAAPVVAQPHAVAANPANPAGPAGALQAPAEGTGCCPSLRACWNSPAAEQARDRASLAAMFCYLGCCMCL